VDFVSANGAQEYGDDVKNLERLLMDTAAQLFGRGADAEIQEGAERGEFPHSLWQELDDNGLLSALLPESAGGAGLAPSAALSMMRVAGAMALPLPLAETLWGRHLLFRLAAEHDSAPLVVVSASAAGLDVECLEVDGIEVARLSGRLRWPWPAVSTVLVVVDDLLIPVTRQQQKGWELIDLELSLSGEPNGVLELDGFEAAVLRATEPPTSSNGAANNLEDESLEFLAAAHCQRIAGGLERILDLAIEHVQGREQFGRPIANFQAVQHLVAQLAAEVAVVGAAADSITAHLADPSRTATIAVAAARARANEAAATGSRIAHQLLGAIGYTREHSLHRFTRRLLRWRDEHGDEGFWQQRVGVAAIEAGGKGLWQLLVD
jgi:acyl-CoA dehydrogenase